MILLSTLALGAVLAIGPAPPAGFAEGLDDLPVSPSALPGFAEGRRLSPSWEVDLLPNQKSPATEFTIEERDGREALVLRAVSSFGNVTHRLKGAGDAGRLSWSWRVERFATGADLRHKRGDDNAIKVCAFFDLPLEQIPFWDRFMLKRARSRAKRDLAAATVCYAWDPRLPEGTRLNNPFSKRLRYIVLRSGPAESSLGRDESRDLVRDFLELFREESQGLVPPLIGISVGADSDNTEGDSLAWIADLKLRRLRR